MARCSKATAPGSSSSDELGFYNALYNGTKFPIPFAFLGTLLLRSR